MFNVFQYYNFTITSITKSIWFEKKSLCKLRFSVVLPLHMV